MSTLKELIQRSRGDTSYWEEKMRQLVYEFEKTILDLKDKAETEIKNAVQDVIFRDLEPAKKLAQQTAQSEIKQFKQETNERVLNILKNVEQTKKDILEKVNKQIDIEHKLFMGEVKKLLQATTQETTYIFEKLENNITELENELQEKVNTLQGPQGETGLQGEAGKDADPEVVANIVLNKIPKQEEITAQSIAIKLETLKGDERIGIPVIKGLKEYLDNLTRAIREKVKSSSGSGGGIGNIQHEKFNVDETTTTITAIYPIAGNGTAIIGLFYNGQQQHRGTHYTVGTNKKTITLLFTPDSSPPQSEITITYIRG